MLFRSLLPWNETQSLRRWMLLFGVEVTLILYSELSAIQTSITEHMFSDGI